MNKLPELKSFLKDGEAERYEGVSVKYVHGRTAVMTVYVDGVEKERVPLHTIKNKQAMHSLMVEKGFVLKTNSAEETEHKQKDTGLKAPPAGQNQMDERQKKREELEDRRKNDGLFGTNNKKINPKTKKKATAATE